MSPLPADSNSLNVQRPSRPAMHATRRLPLATALTCLLLGGCVVGPDFKRLDRDMAGLGTTGPAYTRAADDLPGASGDISSHWWENYQSARINQLVALALAHNPSIDVAIGNLKAAQNYVAAQRGFFFPTVQAGYSATRENVGPNLTSPLVSNANPYSLHTAQLTVGFVPDVFGGNRRAVESLQAQADSQRHQLEALRTSIASNVVAAVLQESYLTNQIDVSQSAIKAAKNQLEHLRITQQSGYSSGLDLAQQQVAYAQTIALLPPLQKALEQTRDLIAVLCGQLPAQPLPPAEQGSPTLPAQMPRVLPSQLVAHRPDVKAAEEQFHSALAQIGVATANLLPQLSLGASVGNSASTFNDLFSGGPAWSLIAGLTQPLYAGGTLSARKRAAEDIAEAARAQYKVVVLTAFQNVTDTLYALENDQRALQAARDVEQATLKLRDHIREQYRSGYTSLLLLLIAEQSYLQTNLTRISAEANYAGDTVSLYQALGGGWRDDDVAVGAGHEQKAP